MRIPYCIKGALFVPILFVLVLVLKAICPVAESNTCFADFMAVPIFLPLAVIYDLLGSSRSVAYEFWIVLFYWLLIGFLIGLIFDLYRRRSQY